MGLQFQYGGYCVRLVLISGTYQEQAVRERDRFMFIFTWCYTLFPGEKSVLEISIMRLVKHLFLTAKGSILRSVGCCMLRVFEYLQLIYFKVS